MDLQCLKRGAQEALQAQTVLAAPTQASPFEFDGLPASKLVVVPTSPPPGDVVVQHLVEVAHTGFLAG